MIKRTFGHCLVHWKISNFCLDIFQERCNLRSPAFTINIPETTEWEMAIETIPDEDSSVFLHLKRLNSGPRIVWANWTIDLKDFEGRTIVDYECESYFERRQIHVLDLESAREVVDTVINSEIDSVEITCRIFVKSESNESETEPQESIDIGLSSLSKDLRRLLKTGKYYDVVVRIGNKDIRAHKSILARRNDSLRLLISNCESKLILLTDVNAEVVEAVITYLYTGNLQGILRNPSIDLHKFINLYEVEELKPHFLPDSVEISSKILVEESCFRLMVPHFHRKRTIISSEELRRDNLNSTWRLHIYPRGYNCCSEFIAVQAEVVSAVGTEVACVELSLLDVNNETVNKVKIICHLVAGEWFGFEHFIDRQYLDDILRHNQLRIVFKVRVSRGVTDSTTVSKPNIGQTEIRSLPYYHMLSAAMKSVFNEVLYKDVTLKVRGKNLFRAHRCILAARSKIFANLLARSADNINVDMETSILRAFLQYIYSGVLEELETSKLFQLYTIAERYTIDALKLDCCRFLLSKINVQNMREIFAFADENQERDLRLTSNRFIKTYKNHTPDE